MNNALDATVAAHRALAAAGHADLVWGHVGVRDPDGRGVWSKAAGWGLEEVTADRLVLVDFDGNQIEGHGRRHIEAFIHTEAMKARKDANATVHTHSRAAISFAALDIPLLPLSHDAIPFLYPDVVRFAQTGDLIKNQELGAALALAVAASAGCLIPGHGMVTVGRDVAEAVMHAVLLERACELQLRSLSAGEIRRQSSAREVADKQAGLWSPTQLQAGFDYLVRRADAQFDAAHLTAGGVSGALLPS